MKKVVHYSTLIYCTVGDSATVVPTDHTNHMPGQFAINGEVCNTSTVLSYDAATGVFQTKYSEYRPDISLRFGE